MRKVRVMIIEDSSVVRQFLEYVIRRDARLEVVAAVGTAEEALRILDRVSPDVISMDIRLPGMNGFEATQRIMATRPTPVVVVSASVEAEDMKISINALRAGALAVVEKPVGIGHEHYESLAERLCTQLAIMSQVKVVGQRIDRGLRFGPGGMERVSCTPERIVSRTPGPFRALGLVASTGGPNALANLLGNLPADFPLPILLIQHITASFLGGFVSWLNSICPLSVVFAQDKQRPAAGKVHVPPADHHLRLAGDRLGLDQENPVCAQRPSGTVLLQSMGQSLGPRALGVLLTGMGEDGAEGLKVIRDHGGYTIAEDATTAVVYGMPAAAVRLGAVHESLPLPDIAPRILELIAGKEVSR